MCVTMHETHFATQEGNTPLHVACEGGYIETAKWLMNRGANTRWFNMVSYIPLELSVARLNQFDIILIGGLIIIYTLVCARASEVYSACVSVQLYIHLVDK